MKKVIISRPRVGGINHCGRRKINAHQIDEFGDFDDGYPRKISAKKDTIYLHGDEKSQTDLMGPLRRYLRKQLGRPWNDVWSEICENNKDYMGEHLKMHIGWEVVTDCRFNEDGELVSNNGYTFYRQRFYVDPNTGFLCISKGSSFKRQKPELRIVEMDGMEYYCHEDIWYRVKTIPYKKPDRLWYVDFDIFGNVNDYNGFYTRYGKAVRCTWKQQANSKEIKKLNRLCESRQAA